MQGSLKNNVVGEKNYISRGEAVHQRVKEYMVQQINARFPGYYQLVESRIDELVHQHTLNEILAIVQKEVISYERKNALGMGGQPQQ